MKTNTSNQVNETRFFEKLANSANNLVQIDDLVQEGVVPFDVYLRALAIDILNPTLEKNYRMRVVSRIQLNTSEKIPAMSEALDIEGKIGKLVAVYRIAVYGLVSASRHAICRAIDTGTLALYEENNAPKKSPFLALVVKQCITAAFLPLESVGYALAHPKLAYEGVKSTGVKLVASLKNATRADAKDLAKTVGLGILKAISYPIITAVVGVPLLFWSLAIATPPALLTIAKGIASAASWIGKKVSGFFSKKNKGDTYRGEPVSVTQVTELSSTTQVIKRVSNSVQSSKSCDAVIDRVSSIVESEAQYLQPIAIEDNDVEESVVKIHDPKGFFARNKAVERAKAAVCKPGTDLSDVELQILKTSVSSA